MSPWLALFLKPQGRIGRRTFWLGWLVLTAANLALIPISLRLLGPEGFRSFGLATPLVTLYPTVCLYAKRLRDFGASPWLQAAPRALWTFWLLIVLAPTKLALDLKLSIPALVALVVAVVTDPVLFGMAGLRRSSGPRPNLTETFS